MFSQVGQHYVSDIYSQLSQPEANICDEAVISFPSYLTEETKIIKCQCLFVIQVNAIDRMILYVVITSGQVRTMDAWKFSF